MNHRQQFQLEGPMGGHLIWAAESALRSDQVAQSFKPSCLKTLQGWKLHSLYGLPAPALDCSQSSISFYPTFSLFTAYPPTVSHSPMRPHWEGGGSVFLTTPRWVLASCCWASPEAIPSQGWIRFLIPQPPHTGQVLLLNLFSCFTSFLYWAAQGSAKR